jgi:hypothetical protein
MQSKYDELKAIIINSLNIFPEPLLNSMDFAQYASKFKLSLVEEDVNSLWSVGLLNADLITSDKMLKIKGIDLVSTENKLYHFADNRRITAKENWAGTLTADLFKNNKINIYFHKFRFFVLYTINRFFKYSIHPFQFLYNEKMVSKIVQIENEDNSRSRKGAKFSERIIWVNNLTTLVICCVPNTYDRIYDEVDFKIDENHEYSKNDYRIIIEKILIEIGLEEIEKIRKHLCVIVEYLDPNKMLHIMLRMSQARMRKSLEGDIGSSMLLFSMAESLRLSTEQAFNISLPEEDELGFVGWNDGVKLDVFGAPRLYDANPGVKLEYMRQWGVDFGTKIRCYFEGETEIGALKSVVTPSNLIDFINLKGKVYEKGVPAFRDSLRSDIKNKVLSIVVIDADRDDYVRAIRKACEEDDICGRVFFLDPDFEFGNFGLNELVEIVRKISIDRGGKNINLNLINESAKNCKSGKEFETAIRSLNLEFLDIRKGEIWGEHLMNYANCNPLYPPEHPRQGERTIIEIKNLLIRFTTKFCSHELTLKKYKINPKDGSLIPR